MSKEGELRGRFRGCLLGGALGDALGYPVEFLNRAEIVRRFGPDLPERLTFEGAKTGVVSDDTQMTLFTAEGVIRAVQRRRDRGICNPVAVLAKAYLRWYATQTDGDRETEYPGWLIGERRLWVRRAPGNTCMSALGHLARSGELPSLEKPPNDSKGCGAVMRVAPIGLAAATRKHAFEMGRDSGVLTHGHPSGYLSAAYLASVVWDLARGAGLGDAIAKATKLCRAERGHEELLDIVDRAVALSQKGPPSSSVIEQLGGGWTGEEALAIALLCALTAGVSSPDGMRAALWRAAAHSGDSDSTAAICGNLLGAMVGADSLPKAWLAELELREVIERLSDDLYRATPGDEPLDLVAYPPN